jgi:NAD(P)-dependent dehydrogenase (short-subunit alcohol dehydrogenase family)
MQIERSTALVTGANRGLGRLLAAELLARGGRVYAGARHPEAVGLPGVVPVTRAFAPQAGRRRAQRRAERAAGAVVGQLSGQRRLLRGQVRGVVADQCPAPGAGRPGYPGRRPARGLHGHRHGPPRRRPPRAIDRAVVAKLALDELEAGSVEILADDVSRRVQAGLADGVAALYPQFA